MKRRNYAIAAWMAAILLTISLNGCTVEENALLQSHTWYMTTAQSNQSGEVVAYNPNTVLDGGFSYSGCAVVELTCHAVDGQIVLENASDGTSYCGTYQKVSEDPVTTVYRLLFDEGEGMATISVTKYADGTQKATMVISVGGYALGFTTDTLPAVA